MGFGEVKLDECSFLHHILFFLLGPRPFYPSSERVHAFTPSFAKTSLVFLVGLFISNQAYSQLYPENLQISPLTMRSIPFLIFTLPITHADGFPFSFIRQREGIR